MDEIVAVNFHQRIALTEAQATIEIFLHDIDGEEVDDLEDAVFFTAQMPDGGWVHHQLDEFGETMH